MITDGAQLPDSKKLVKLAASSVGTTYDVDDAQIDDFLKKF